MINVLLAPRRTACVAALVTLLTAVAILFGAREARATSSNGWCEPDEVCLFEHADYRGRVLADRSRADLEYWGYALPGWAINLASSFANRTSRYFCLYAWEHPGTMGWVLRPYEWNNISVWWNDQTDGIRPC
jgi:hypothetical protein